MEYDRDNGLRHVDPKKYAHNIRIKKIFEDAKQIAWNKIKTDPRIAKLIEEERKKDKDAISANKRSVDALLNIRK